MASTAATDKQSEAIKQRMAEIRSDLPYAADVARERVKQLTDWKYHMARRPLPILAAAAVVGYLIIPAKQTSERIVVHRNNGRDDDLVSQPAKKGLAGGIAGALATIAMKQAASLAMSQLSNLVSKRGQA